jgi:DNA (cytosine-5)-methyltransferase 1
MGLHRAWSDAEITGVDIKPQPRYPFNFVQADALGYSLEGYDFIWASPPCQSYSLAMKHLAAPQPMLIEEVRNRLRHFKSWVIENVFGAPLQNPFILCGTNFGLRVHRHRIFESNFLPALYPPCTRSRNILNPHRSESRERFYREYGRQDPEKFWAKEMGVGWMNRHEAREAIPPAYSCFIAKTLECDQKTPRN